MSTTTKERLKKLQSVTAIGIGGDTFHARALSLGELEDLDARVEKEGKEDRKERAMRYVAHLIAASVCEADGTKVFDGPDDPDLTQINTEALRELADHAAAVNGLVGGDEGNA